MLCIVKLWKKWEVELIQDLQARKDYLTLFRMGLFGVAHEG